MNTYFNDIKNYNTRQACPRPGKCAFLVIDQQNYFIPMASPIIGNVFSIIESCHRTQIKTIFTRHGHRNMEKDGGMLLKRNGKLLNP